MKPKLATVIIPVYNIAPFIADALASVLRQTYPNFEVVAVDDGSTDGSDAICRRFRDPRLRVVRQANRGLAGARNTGIRHARGEYLGFLDGDDLWLPDKLARHIAHLERAPEVGVSFSRSAILNHEGRATGEGLMPRLRDISPLDVLLQDPVGNGSAAVVRRRVMEEIAIIPRGRKEKWYFQETLRQAEDVECWLRILLLTDWQFEGLPDVLTGYRLHTASLTNRWRQHWRAWVKMLNRVREYAPEFLADVEQRARAYRLQYLARNALRRLDGPLAFGLMCRALRYRPLWREQPRRVMAILSVAGLLQILPASQHASFERCYQNATRFIQKSRIRRERAFAWPDSHFWNMESERNSSGQRAESDGISGKAGNTMR